MLGSVVIFGGQKESMRKKIWHIGLDSGETHTNLLG
jgi:hypothetical protein